MRDIKEIIVHLRYEKNKTEPLGVAGNVLVPYSVNTGFDSRSGYWLSFVRCFVVLGSTGTII
jgi:hypothetical protein